MVHARKFDGEATAPVGGVHAQHRFLHETQRAVQPTNADAAAKEKCSGKLMQPRIRWAQWNSQ